MLTEKNFVHIFVLGLGIVGPMMMDAAPYQQQMDPKIYTEQWNIQRGAAVVEH